MKATLCVKDESFMRVMRKGLSKKTGFLSSRVSGHISNTIALLAHSCICCNVSALNQVSTKDAAKLNFGLESFCSLCYVICIMECSNSCRVL